MLSFPRTRTSVVLLTVLAAAGILAAGCGDDTPSRAATKPPAKTPTTPTIPTNDPDLIAQLADDQGTKLRDAGCSIGSFDEEEAVHVTDADQLGWKTNPPTSGTHFPDWAPFGRYDEELDPGYVVHNLEHGGVAVWYGPDVDAKTLDAIDDLLDDEEKWIVSPRANVDGITSAAWTKLLTCPQTALAKLTPKGTAAGLDAWYDAVVSTGSASEKDLPAYAGSMKDPVPTRDISAESPF